MNRLTHSFESTIRSFQISNTELFFFVEGGKNDRYFYSKTCAPLLGKSPFTYEFRMPEELPSLGGGKTALITLFNHLRNNKKLDSCFKGRRKLFAFFMDKDVDDINRKTLRSDHIIYTEHYDVENYIFKHGDITNAAAACASIDQQHISKAVGNPNTWRAKCAEIWKEWIVICLFAKQHGVSIPNYQLPQSRIHNPTYENLCPVAHKNYLNDLKLESGLDESGFQEELGKTMKLVDKFFAAGNHDKVFKGKWYAGFLVNELKGLEKLGIKIDNNGLIKRLPATTAATIRFEDSWANQLRAKVEKVLKKLERPC